MITASLSQGNDVENTNFTEFYARKVNDSFLQH